MAKRQLLLLSDIEKFHSSYAVMPNGCWTWQKAISRAGYAVMRATQDARPRAVNAHRWGYKKIVGDIPNELQLDHLCRNTACVNPAHLEPVSHATNVRRGLAMQVNDYCKRGHAMSGDNLSVQKGGKRKCLACKRISNALQWERHGEHLIAYHRAYRKARAKK